MKAVGLESLFWCTVIGSLISLVQCRYLPHYNISKFLVIIPYGYANKRKQNYG